MPERATAPSPATIKAAREQAGLSQTAAARLVHAGLRTWQQWEAGDRHMSPGLWELFCLKTLAASPQTPPEGPALRHLRDSEREEPMHPTFTLRWLVRKNPVTAVEVKLFQREEGVTLSEARKRLERETPQVLQQWWEDAEGRGEWRDVVLQVEPHPVE